MATQAELEYLRRQNARLKSNAAQGMQVITQGQSSEGEDTSWSALAQSNAVQTQDDQPKKESNFWSDAFGFVDELAARFGSGFVGAFEGIADLGATALAALGDATGWYDSKPLTDWAQIDYASKAAEWTKNFANYTPWGIANAVQNLGDENYRRNYLAGLFGGPAAALVQTLRDDVGDGKEYYAYNDQALENFNIGDFQAGEFLGGAAESIGFMVPSIMLGNVAGGTTKLAEAARLGSMGVSAAGQSATQALDEGATAGQALGYGIASGAVESATEMIPWPGGNKFAGLATKNALGKMAVKSFVKEAIEEGLEEIVSASVDPLLKTIYKGSDALNEYKTKEFWQNMGLSFASGAFVGGLMNGMSTLQNVNYFGGVKQYNSVQQMQSLNEARAETIENLKKGKITTDMAYAKFAELSDVSDSIIKDMEGYGKDFVKKLSAKPLTEEQYAERNEALRKADLAVLADPRSYSEYQENYYSDAFDEFKKQIRSDFDSRIAFSRVLNEFSKITGYDGIIRVGADTEFNENDKAFHVGFNTETGKAEQIVLNPKYKNQFAQLIGHEGLFHSFFDSDEQKRNVLFDKIEKLDGKALHANDQKILQTYNSDPRIAPITQDSSIFKSEQLAHYLEQSISNYNQLLKIASGEYGFMSALKDAFLYSKRIGNVRAMMAIANAMKALTATEETAKGKLATQFSKNLKDNFGTIKLDDMEYGVSTQTKQAIDAIDTLAMGVTDDDNQTQGNEDGDFVHPNGKYVRKVNAACEKMLDYLREEYFDIDNIEVSEIETVEEAEETIKRLKEVQGYNTEDFRTHLSEAIDAIENGDYKDDVNPDTYSYIQELYDYFDNIENYQEDTEKDLNKRLKELKKAKADEEAKAKAEAEAKAKAQEEAKQAEQPKAKKKAGVAVQLVPSPTRVDGKLTKINIGSFRGDSLEKIRNVNVVEDLGNNFALTRTIRMGTGEVKYAYLVHDALTGLPVSKTFLDQQEAIDYFKLVGKEKALKVRSQYLTDPNSSPKAKALKDAYDQYLQSQESAKAEQPKAEPKPEKKVEPKPEPKQEAKLAVEEKPVEKTEAKPKTEQKPKQETPKQDKAKEQSQKADTSEKAVKKSTLDQVIEGYQNTVDYYQEELSISKMEARDLVRAMKTQYAEETRFIKSFTPLAQQLTLAHINSRIHADGILAIPTDAESIVANAEKSMLVPFSQAGVVSKGKLQLKVFTPAIQQLADAYTAENFQGLYNPAIAQALNKMAEWGDQGTATPLQEQSALALYKAMRKVGGEAARQVELGRITSAAEADYGLKAVGAYNPESTFSRTFKKVVSMVSDPRASIDMYFSSGTLVGDKLINEGSKQAGFARVYEFDAQTKIAEIQKQLGLDKKVNDVEIDGTKMPFLAALEWRLMLSMPEGTKEFKNGLTGYSFTDPKTEQEVIVDFSEQAYSDLEKAISDDYLDRARKLIVDDFYGKYIYDEIAKVYYRATKLDYGELFPRGEYMRLATRQLRTSLLTPKVSGVPSTSNLMKRSKASGPIMMNGGLFSKMTQTARMVAYESYLQPLVTEVDHILNTLDKPGDKTIMSKLNEPKKQFLKWYVQSLTGAITPEKTGAFGQAMTGMVLANFKIAPIQTLSAFVSGLSVNEQFFFRPNLIKNSMKPSGKYQTALTNLFEVLPEAKYRGESNDVYYGNVGDVKDTRFSQGLQAIGRFVSKATGTNYFDKATIRYLLLTAMQTEAKKMGLSIDDPQVAKSVEQRARTLFMTQISNNSKHFSPAQFVSNPYGSTDGTKAAMMRIIKAYGGAAKAFTNFFNRTILQVARQHQTGKWLSQHSIAEYEDAIARDEQGVEDTKNAVNEAEANLEKATVERIELRDKRTKDKQLTAQWELAREKVRDLKDRINEASKVQGNEAVVENLKTELQEAENKAKELKSGFNKEDQAAYEKAVDAEREAKRELKKKQFDLRVAENQLAEDKGHKSYYEKTKASHDAWVKNHSASKALFNLSAGLVLAGLGKTLIDLIYDLLFRRKDWNEFTSGEMTGDLFIELALNSTVNLYPGLRTITGFFQGYDAADPTVKTIQLVSDTAKAISTFAQNPNEGNGKALMRDGLKIASLVLGIPFSTIYEQVTGIIGHASPETALQMKDVFYQVSSTATAKFNSAVEAGDTRNATAYLNNITEDRIGKVSNAVRSELLSLAKTDNAVLPSSLPTYYVNEKEEKVAISWTQQQNAKKFYSVANAQVDLAIRTSTYKKMSSAGKASVIKAIYNAYKNAALDKTVGNLYNVQMTKASLLAKTGNKKVGEMIAAVSYIRTLTATAKETRKELATKYVNSLNLTRNEKLIVLKMAGFQVDADALKTALRQKGMASSDIEKFVS